MFALGYIIFFPRNGGSWSCFADITDRIRLIVSPDIYTGYLTKGFSIKSLLWCGKRYFDFVASIPIGYRFQIGRRGRRFHRDARIYP